MLSAIRRFLNEIRFRTLFCPAVLLFGMDARNAGDPALGVPIQADWGAETAGRLRRTEEKKTTTALQSLMETKADSLICVYTELTELHEMWPVPQNN